MSHKVDGRTSRHAHRRPELLALGAEQLLEVGLSCVSMRPFGQAIGVSHAALLHHFTSKELLLRELIEHLANQELAHWTSLANDTAVEALVRELWARYASERGQRMFRLMFEAIGLRSQNEELYGPLAEQMAAPWQLALEGMIQSFDEPPDRASSLATLAIGQFRGLLLDLLATGDRDRVDAAFELWLVETVRPRVTTERNNN